MKHKPRCWPFLRSRVSVGTFEDVLNHQKKVKTRSGTSARVGTKTRE